MFSIGPCSFLLLRAGTCCLCLRKRAPTIYCQQHENKEEVHQCEYHAKSFCVWIKRHTIGTIWMTMRKRATISQINVVSRALNNLREKCSSVNTVAVWSVRCPAGGIIATTVLSASTPVMSMSGKQGIG